MTNIRVLHLAYAAALNNWDREYSLAKVDPNNKSRERRAWNELKEIEALIKEEESK